MTGAKSLFVYAAAALFMLVVAAAVVWQLWWLPVVPVVLLLALWAFEKPLLLFYVLLASIPWSMEYQFSDALGTDFPDEPLMWLSALAALFIIITQYKNVRRNIGSNYIIWLLILQVLWAALTVSTSTYPLLSIKYVLAKCWYLGAFMFLPLLLLDTKEKIRHAALVLASSMSVVVVLTLVRHAALGFTFATINDSLRPFFRNHVNYSALLVFMIPLLVVFVKGATHRPMRLLWRAVLVISLVALYLSYARGAWVALVAGGAAYGLLKKKALVLSFLVMLFLVFVSVFWLQQNDRYLNYAHHYNTTIFHTNFAEHLVATYELKDMSTAERFYRWVAGVRMIKDGWMTGFGPNTFYNNYKSYAVPAFRTWVSANAEHSTVHNYFLLLLIEQGVIGLLLFVVLLTLAFYKAQQLYYATTDVFWKHTLAAVTAILVMVCVINFLSDLIEADKVGPVFYLCLAVLMIADAKIRQADSDLAAHVQRIT